MATYPNEVAGARGASPMAWTYFKRYRMEIDLVEKPPEPVFPPNYRFLPWRDELLMHHARVKFQSFRHEIDANVFACFTHEDGCRRLMEAIRRKPGFLPEATWLAAFQDDSPPGRLEYCGTIQGILDLDTRVGAIQNVGVTPGHRNRGIGSALLMLALNGFHEAGAIRAFLEVTAENEGAIQLYERLGFAIVRTVYKVADVPAGR